ncbi:hypothetical protein KIN20_017965 [Parelaphostrongylus tenuis]|uniref:Ig-like domain-containing protein n=1 Tax=Parelaphostrongylus tenuis TaxID=148309 RepID=A0AAD5QRS8_PARTN|nr:hypothetical protein KIN20_017965 [Parelaphostrongylus tenuis]
MFPLLLLLVALFTDVDSQETLPRLLILPATNPVQKPSGQQVSLLCSIEGAPNETRPGIIWSKHDGIDKTGNVEVKSLDYHTMSLLIKNTTSDDSGVYTCQGQIGNRLLSRTVDVIIFENFDFTDKKTSFRHVKPSAAVNLSCEVTPSSIKVHTVWTRDGIPVAQIGQKDKFKLLNDDAILQIINYAPIKDAGEYMCKVFHPTTGSTLYRKITIGSETENKHLFCSKMCNNVCNHIYPSVLN